MKHKAFVITVLLFVVLLSPFLFIFFAKLHHPIFVNEKSSKASQPTPPTSAPIPTLKSNVKSYSFPTNRGGELYNEGVVLFIGYIDKETLTLSGTTTDFLPMGRTQERGMDVPTFVLEEFDIDGKLLRYQALSAFDRLSESPKPLDYWVISSKYALQPKTMYWQVKHLSTQKVVWNDNIHTLLLQQTVSMVPDNFFTTPTGREELKTEITKIGEHYINKDVPKVKKSLQTLKKNVELKISDNTEVPTPLHVTRKELLDLIDTLLNKL